jgi:hypothetical protein
VQKAALVETHQPAAVAPNQNPPTKSLTSSFSESLIYSGKQGGGATVLGEGNDIVTRETRLSTSLNNLGEAVELHSA